jgi:flagellar protein FliO/FliZ
MEFLEQLLNVELGLPARFIIAFVTVLLLIALTAWIVRRVAAGRGGIGGVRTRHQRLAVIDAAQVDAKRRLLLVRRDNTEHLLLIGGPSDIVVESRIGLETREDQPEPRAPQRVEPQPGSAAPQARPFREEIPSPPRPARPPSPPSPPPAAPPRQSAPPPSRPAPPPQSEPPQPRSEPSLRPPPASAPSSGTPESSSPSPAPSAPRPPEPRIAPEVRSSLFSPRSEPPVPRTEPAPPPPRPAPPPASSSDPKLEDMAQRLESALKRPLGGAPQSEPAPPASASEPARGPDLAAAMAAELKVGEQPPDKEESSSADMDLYGEPRKQDG